MKAQNITLFFSLLIFAFTLNAQNSWTMLTPAPQENTINCIKKIPGTNKLIAVCSGSTIMFSLDYGYTWQIFHNPAGKDNDFVCQSTIFLSEDVGFISGSYASILKTNDGGLTWNEVYAGSNNASYLFYDFAFKNQVGIAVGYLGHIVRTLDEGETWTEVASGVTYQLNALDFCLDEKVIAVGSDENQIVVSYDSGQTWETETINPSVTNGILRDIKFVTNSVGFILASGSPQNKILRTIDGGATWNIVYTGYYSPRAIDNYDDMHIAVSCHREIYESGVLLSENNGLTWEEFSCYSGFSWNANWSIVLINDIMDLIMAGNMGMMFWSSAGYIWNNLYERTFWGEIYQVQFLNQNNGFVLAESHTGGMAASDILNTHDGGLTWNLCGSIGNYQGTFFSISPEVYILAYYLSNLMLKKTTDGGFTWTYVNTGFYFEPYCIKFNDVNNGLITGEGYIIKTTDSGETWQEVIPGGGWIYFYFDIEYLSPDTVFAVGEGMPNETIITKSFDGGITWIVNIIGNYGPAQDICFVTGNTAFLACQNNTILNSTDGGETWYETVLNNSNPIEFKSISFPSQNIGFAVGDGSYENIVKTIDGGETWYPINSHTTSGLNSVYFFDDNTGLVFGENGVVLKTTTGGITGFEEPSFLYSGKFMEIYPNPFTNKVNINLKLSENIYSGQITIFDMTGKALLNFRIVETINNIEFISDDLNAGIYFVVLSVSSGVVETKKIIKL